MKDGTILILIGVILYSAGVILAWPFFANPVIVPVCWGLGFGGFCMGGGLVLNSKYDTPKKLERG
jgi:hypothetical protein